MCLLVYICIYNIVIYYDLLMPLRECYLLYFELRIDWYTNKGQVAVLRMK